MIHEAVSRFGSIIINAKQPIHSQCPPQAHLIQRLYERPLMLRGVRTVSNTIAMV